MRRLASVSGRSEVATACRMERVVSPLLPFLPLQCPSSSPMNTPMDVLPAYLPVPHPGLTWMSRSCFMSSGGSWVETPGAETGDVVQPLFWGWGFCTGRVLAPCKSRVSLTQEELIEQHALPEGRMCDLSGPYSNPGRWAHLSSPLLRRGY